MDEKEKNENEKNKKKKGKKNYLVNILILVLAVVFIGSAGYNLRLYLKHRQTEKDYNQIAESAAQAVVTPSDAEKDTEPPYVSPIDFESLKKENPDTIGWIRIPDTRVDYPIVQREGDNDYYLKRDFHGQPNEAGAIYLDFESEKDFVGRNNVLYGHHMKEGSMYSMFRDVANYKNQEFFKDHQYFSIYTPDREIRLKAVACYYGNADKYVSVRRTVFITQEQFDTWLQAILSPCSYREEVLYPARNVYCLVTCSYEVENARTFLFAVEVDEEGNELGLDEEFEVYIQDLMVQRYKERMGVEEVETEKQTEK